MGHCENRAVYDNITPKDALKKESEDPYGEVTQI